MGEDARNYEKVGWSRWDENRGVVRIGRNRGKWQERMRKIDGQDGMRKGGTKKRMRIGMVNMGWE